MARFVVLRHDGPRGLHWDFMLECGPTLRTWALSRLPEQGEEIECEPLPDHRPAYLDYEGPISEGRGTVERWDAGTFEIRDESDGELWVELHGQRLIGRVRLWRASDSPRDWRFCHAG
jgi:hypothetical protein